MRADQASILRKLVNHARRMVRSDQHSLLVLAASDIGIDTKLIKQRLEEELAKLGVADNMRVIDAGAYYDDIEGKQWREAAMAVVATRIDADSVLGAYSLLKQAELHVEVPDVELIVIDPPESSIAHQVFQNLQVTCKKFLACRVQNYATWHPERDTGDIDALALRLAHLVEPNAQAAGAA